MVLKLVMCVMISPDGGNNMGMTMGFSSSSNNYSVPNPNNTDPMIFTIEKSVQINQNVVALIYYPTCTNFDGRKICLFLDITIKKLSDRSKIDPHFYESEESPFARFKPTSLGWNTAIELAKNIVEE